MGTADPCCLVTERLVLRRITPGDAAFILELLNEPGWLRHIGDRNVHTLDEARAFMESRMLPLHARFGFGFYRAEMKSDRTVVGMCCLLRRDGLDDVDLRFAFLARHAGHGFAREAAEAVVRHAGEDLGLARLVAITRPDNLRSIALLEKLGMRLERPLRLPGGDEELRLYGMSLGAPSA